MKKDMQAIEPIAVRFGHLLWSLSNRITAIIGAPTHFQRTIIVARPPSEVYGFWRDFNNLAAATRSVDRIEVTDPRHSRWTVAAPFGLKLSWGAEITTDETKRRIAWRTVAPADVPHTGQVLFHGIDDGKATEVAIAVDYRMPLGPLGEILVKILGGGPNAFIEEEISRFKSVIESAAVDTTTAPAEAEEEITGTAALLREARDIESGGAINHPELIASLDEDRSHAAQTAEANNDLATAMGPPNPPSKASPKKTPKHSRQHVVGNAADQVQDKRGRLRTQH